MCIKYWVLSGCFRDGTETGCDERPVLGSPYGALLSYIVLWKIRVQKYMLYDLICGIKGKEMYIKLT